MSDDLQSTHPGGNRHAPPGHREGARRSPIEGFEILEEIGRGGMGVVYKARQEGLKRVVALKMIRAGEVASGRMLERFRFEAEAAARLQHPHIVQIFQVGEAHGVPFLVLEFLEGGNLAEHMGGRPMPPRDAARLVETLARAIHHAHRRGIVHRDLKPSNIMLSADGTPKIGDFGLAKGLYDVEGPGSLSEVVGTVGYMSPEQAWGARGADDIGPASDVYALGVILYELLTGNPPFQGGSHLEVLRLVWSCAPRPPSTSRPGLSRDLETICLTCLEKEPAKRYGDAEALADDLRRFLSGVPIAARPVGRAERSWRWCRRNPLTSGLLAALVASLLGGFAMVTIKWVEARAARTLAQLGEHAAGESAREARRAEREARDEREKSERALASFLIVAAERESAAGNVDRAAELLGRSRPDLRNWEWSYLRRLCEGSLLTIPTGARKAESVAFSPDGSRLATAGDGGPGRRGEVTLWEAGTGRKLRSFPGHEGTAWAVTFSPDGRKLASAGGDGMVRIWDAETGAAIRTIPGFARSVAYRPDGRQIAVGDARSVRIHDADDGRIVRTLGGHSGAVIAVAYNSDGSRLASAASYTDDKGLDHEREPVSGEVKVWDAGSGRELATLRDARTRSVGGIALSPDGSRVAMADGHPAIPSARPGEVVLWDVGTGREVRTMRGHLGRVLCVAFRPDGRQVVSAGDDRMLRVWDAESGRPVRTLRGHGSPVISVAFRPDGSRIASAEGRLAVVKVWDPAEDPESRSCAEAWECVAFLPPDKFPPRLVAGGEGGTVRVWSPSGGANPLVLRGHEAPVTAVASRPGGSQVASASFDGTVRIWSSVEGRQLLLLGENSEVSALAYSPDGRHLAISARGAVVIRDADNGGHILTIEAHPGEILGLAYGHDGARLATAGAEGAVKVWDAKSGALVASRADLRTPTGVAFPPMGGRLAIATGAEGTVQLWDYLEGRSDVTLLRHDGWVRGVAFNHDGTRLASACDDGTVKIWDVALAQALLTLRDPEGAGLQGVAFGPDGRHLAAAGPARVVVWDASPP